MHFRTRRPHGFTLIEVAIVMCITGLVMGALWFLSSGLINSQKINNLEKGIVTTIGRMRNFYRDRSMLNDNPISRNGWGDPGNNQNTLLMQLNLVAPELLVNGAVQHNLGNWSSHGLGPIDITLGNCNNEYFPSCANKNFNSGYFQIALMGLNGNACYQIVTRLAGTRGQAQALGLIGVTFGGWNALDINNNMTSLDYTPLKSNCVNGTNVYFFFRQ